jgi:hypothetical protein
MLASNNPFQTGSVRQPAPIKGNLNDWFMAKNNPTLKLPDIRTLTRHLATSITTGSRATPKGSHLCWDTWQHGNTFCSA